MDMLTGTFVVINKADGQMTADVISGLTKLKLNLIINNHGELLISVPTTGLGCSLNALKAAVSPACVRIFDDIQTEERTYYDV